MSIYPSIKMDEYYFSDEATLSARVRGMFDDVVNLIMPLNTYFPTILRKPRSFWSINFRPGIKVASKLIGLYDAETQEYIDRQSQRFKQFFAILVSCEAILSGILFLPVFYGYIAFALFLMQINITINTVFALVLFFAPLFLIYRVAFSLSTILLESKFAETLCLMQISYILLELSRPDAIKSRKSELLKRMNFLSNKLILLGTNYLGTDESNKSWTYDHFNKMSRFVRGCERLVIAPTENSLERLRVDLYRFGKILASAQYGSFDLPVAEAENPNQQPKSLLTQSLTVTTRILSLLLPISVLVFMFSYVEAFDRLNINRDSVFYISIAWLLLALDDLIGIGIVEKFMNLVRASKELR